ncbi:MAG: PD40 domain-containing protein [Alphaproteobacteria bacterium]|nr:PD40 domain-containing protein [Alphaproteobacteria bacterium]
MSALLLPLVAAASARCPVVDAPVPPPPSPEMRWLMRDGDRVVGTDGDRVLVWPTRDGAAPQVLFEGEIYPAHAWVMQGDRLINLASGAALSLRGGAYKAEALAPDPEVADGDVIHRSADLVVWATWDSDHVTAWQDGALKQVPRGKAEDRPKGAALGPDGGLWLAEEERVIRVGDPGAGFVAAPITAEALAISPDGASMAVVAYTGVVNLFTLDDARARWSWPSGGAPAFSPNGRWLALSRYDGADVVEVSTGCLQRVVPSRGATLWLDGSTLAWVDAEGRLKLEEAGR